MLPAGARRPRRLRRTAAIRGLVRETDLPPSRLILPIFVTEGKGPGREPIEAMPGVFRHTIASAVELVHEARGLGVRGFAVFPRVADHLKAPDAAEATNPDNLACRALRAIRSATDTTDEPAGDAACLVADVALDPYSSAGHDGLVGRGPGGRPEVINDETVAVLCQQAVVQAEAGADIIAPSDMMDGRIGAIRRTLDAAGLAHAVVMSYTAKYASAFYGPFRSALDSTPTDSPDVPADKRGYQMDPANVREALVEAALDTAESADILMVKPAMVSLDVIAELRRTTDLPVAAYHVSGEYAMIRAAAERGWLDGERCLAESLTAIARAGADIVLTYAAMDYARWWRREHGVG